MRPRYLDSQGHAQQTRWAISYLDVITILLVFFVGIAAKTMQAKPPAPKPPEPKPIAQEAAPKPDLPKPDAPKPEPPKANPLEETQLKLLEHGIDARIESRGVVISLPQAVLFAPGDDRVNAEAVPVVGIIAEVLRSVPNQVELAGYADAQPIHNRRFRNNWELAAARGLRLLDLLTGKYGMDQQRFSTSSYGSLHPRDSNETPDGRASNRRVEIVILSGETL